MPALLASRCSSEDSGILPSAVLELLLIYSHSSRAHLLVSFLLLTVYFGRFDG